MYYRKPDSDTYLFIRQDKKTRCYIQIVSCFGHSPKDDILQPYITQQDFITMYMLLVKILMILDINYSFLTYDTKGTFLLLNL